MKDQFFWGNSTSSMQTEGGWNEGGKSLSVYDIVEPSENSSDWHYANDNYHNFAEDFDLMQDLGMNMYRFQVSWSRVVQDGDGEFNREGIEYYSQLIDELLKRNITPMICLYHFDMPLKLAQQYDGFLSKKVTSDFIRFSKKVIDCFCNKVKYWITFNEQNLYHGPGAFKIAGADNCEKTLNQLYQISHNVMYAHCSICNYLHQVSDAKIGGMLAYSEVYPATCRPLDVMYARKYDEFMNMTLLDAFSKGNYSSEMMKYINNQNIDMKATSEELEVIRHHVEDYICFSYYCSTTINSDKITSDISPNYYLAVGAQANPYLKTTEWNWQIDPYGFRDVLNKIYKRTGLPVFPVENGIGVNEEWDGIHEIEDDYRIEYHKEHIRQMKKAISEDAVPVLGYLGWGLIDILSSQGDMRKRYGVVYVNRTNHDLRDMRRIPKKSYYWLKQTIKNNAEDLG